MTPGPGPASLSGETLGTLYNIHVGSNDKTKQHTPAAATGLGSVHWRPQLEVTMTHWGNLNLHPQAPSPSRYYGTPGLYRDRDN